MDLDISAEDRAFRDEVKAFIDKNLPPSTKHTLSLIHISEPTRPY